MEVKEESIPAENPESVQSPETDGDVFFRGTVVRMTYRSGETGFAVLRAEAEGQNSSLPGQQLATIVGPVPATVAVGTAFIARGEWLNHPKFGKQFKARTFTETPPTSADAIIRYLSSGSIKGFGPVLAERVV